MGYTHADAVRLIADVQQEYVVRYGGMDTTPVDPQEFDAPGGLFVVGYLMGEPVACGGWRAREADDYGLRAGDAELKRMYVVPAARGRGLARTLLRHLERSAAQAGRARMVLETGTEQPEALGLYAAEGYTAVTKFGAYRDLPASVCFAKSLARPEARPEEPALLTAGLSVDRDPDLV